MYYLLLNYYFQISKKNFVKGINPKHLIKKWFVILFFLLFLSLPANAQETGPLLMKQELGYTLGGSVFGAGLGVVVWFMDPLNPSVTLKSTVQNGFVAGTVLGALFGFYMLQNAIIIPQDTTLPENLDQLLGNEEQTKPYIRSMISKEKTISEKFFRIKIFEFRF